MGDESAQAPHAGRSHRVTHVGAGRSQTRLCVSGVVRRVLPTRRKGMCVGFDAIRFDWAHPDRDGITQPRERVRTPSLKSMGGSP